MNWANIRNETFCSKVVGSTLLKTIPSIYETLLCYTVTLKDPLISESCIEIKIELNFYFHTSLWCLKRFTKALKAFIKPFEIPQRSVKIKI